MPSTDQTAAKGWESGAGDLRASFPGDSSLRTAWSEGLGEGKGPDWRPSGCLSEKHGSLMPGDRHQGHGQMPSPSA